MLPDFTATAEKHASLTCLEYSTFLSGNVRLVSVTVNGLIYMAKLRFCFTSKLPEFATTPKLAGFPRGHRQTQKNNQALLKQIFVQTGRLPVAQLTASEH